ncbi:MAG: DNA replication/repair protein RecF [Candidatus Atribacteria bacterium]|nr:DNA replication/repair protein RecF [Candidatus Atribacteria bacterium]MCD6350126.1 DNA replication/repair protein RecF [Candidatus Atribacteria bacterium]
MYFEKLALFNWKNIENTELTFGSRFNVFWGGNAQGKSNLLEAIFFLGRGFSPRRNRNEDLIRWGEDQAYLSATIRDGDIFFRKEVRISLEERDWRLDNRKEKRINYVVGYFPDDLEIISGNPFKRRRFLDEAIAFISPTYKLLLKTYEAILQRRNYLLKQPISRELLDVYTEKIAEVGSRIVKARLKYLTLLSTFFEEYCRKIESSTSRVFLKYRTSGYTIGGEIEIKDSLFKSLDSCFSLDVERGFTSCGPHRDDLEFIREGKSLRGFASWGELKTLALALRLAEASVIKSTKGYKVIVLLDDVFSDLDEERRQFLLKDVFQEEQVFITTTERNWRSFLPQEEVRSFRLEKGRAVKDA